MIFATAHAVFQSLTPLMRLFVVFLNDVVLKQAMTEQFVKTNISTDSIPSYVGQLSTGLNVKGYTVGLDIVNMYVPRQIEYQEW